MSPANQNGNWKCITIVHTYTFILLLLHCYEYVCVNGIIHMCFAHHAQRMLCTSTYASMSCVDGDAVVPFRRYPMANKMLKRLKTIYPYMVWWYWRCKIAFFVSLLCWMWYPNTVRRNTCRISHFCFECMYKWFIWVIFRENFSLLRMTGGFRGRGRSRTGRRRRRRGIGRDGRADRMPTTRTNERMNDRTKVIWHERILVFGLENVSNIYI